MSGRHALQRGMDIERLHRSTRARRVLLALACLAASGFCSLPAWAAATAPPAPGTKAPAANLAVDTSKWTCQFCPYSFGWSGALDFGLGEVSSSSYKFGEYTGLERSGLYWPLAGNLSYRDKDGHFVDLRARNLGLASRALGFDAGKQGLYRATLEYQEIPQFLSESGRTPFLGAGSSLLTLPADWVAAGSTAQMSALGRNLHAVDIENIRRRAGLGLEFTPPASRWHYSVNYRRDTQSGNRILGGNFLTTTSQLPAPMNYRTDQVRASADYLADRWQVAFGYYGSFFHDSDQALLWSNPFLPITPGASAGQMSQPPGNNFNAVNFSGAWQALASTRFMASASAGRLTQNAAYLSPTLNNLLSAAALPGASLNGEVDTLNYALRVYSVPLPQLTLTANYSVNRHDDHTAGASYQQVITDTYISQYVTNLPYSFSRERGDLSASYRIGKRTQLQAGAAHEGESRTFRAAATTRTDSAWAGLVSTPVDSVSTLFKVTRERRYSPDYDPLDYLFAQQNPLLRQFDLANRRRNQLLGQLSYTPSARWSLGASFEDSDDRYDGTSIGLSQSKDVNFSLNLAYTPAAAVSYYGFVTQQNVAWRQAGSTNFSLANWSADQADNIKTAGLGARFPEWRPGLATGVEYTYSLARGATAIATVGGGFAFPNLTMRLQSLGAYAKYTLNPRWGLRFDYRIERYATTDWQLDGVTQATITNVLALGIYSPNYIVNVVAMSAEYRF